MVILAYHKVDNRFEFGLTNVRPGMFVRQISALKKNGIEISASADEEVQGQKAVYLTFDDGYDCFYRNVVPALISFSTKATVFVISDYVGKENTWDIRLSYRPFVHMNAAQIREIAALGFEVGSHSCSHRDLTRLDRKSIWNELRNSKMKIEDLAGREIESVSFPFGKYNSIVAEIAREAGYLRLYGLGSAGSNGVSERLPVYSIDSPMSVRRKAEFNKLEIIKSDFIHSFAEISALISIMRKEKPAEKEGN